MKILLTSLILVISASSFSAEKMVLSKIINKKNKERIQVTCNANFCDEITIEHVKDSGEVIERLSYIPLYQTAYMSGLRGAEDSYNNWEYNGAKKMFQVSADIFVFGVDTADDVAGAVFAPVAEMAAGALMLAPLMGVMGPAGIAVAFAPTAVVIGAGIAATGGIMGATVAASSAVGAVGVMIGAGETIYYLGSDLGNAAINVFHKEARALKKYKKVISGQRVEANDDVFNELKKLVQ